jgi:surface polysaccharide O-acyltransferase-like enzyme
MACALILLTLACRFRMEKYFAALAAALFLVGLAGGAYAATPLGLHIGMNTRNGPFYSTVFVFTGYLVHKHGANLSLRTAYALILGGVMLRLAELYWLMTCYDAHANKIDYLLGTYPFGVGIFIWLLNSPRLGENRWLVHLSRYSAGVYCAHLLFVDLLSATPLFIGNPLWEVTRPFLILGLTFAWVIILARVRFLKPVLT